MGVDQWHLQGIDSGEEEAVQHVVMWPRTKSKATKIGVRTVHESRNVDNEGNERHSRWVTIRLGHKRKETRLFCDTGSNLTIIPPELYRPSMGKVVKATSKLRAWGTDKYLETLGMFKMTLEVVNGGKKETWVYIMQGYKPEPLLGDHDADDLGIITFNPEGSREPIPRPATSRSPTP